MKKIRSILIAILMAVTLLLPSQITSVKADATSWTINYDVVWDATSSVFKLDNIAVNMNGETAVSMTITFPSSLSIASETAGAAWTNRAENNGSLSYLTPGNNTDADFIAYLQSLTFSGTYGTTGDIAIELFEEQMSSWIDPNGYVHYYQFVPVNPTTANPYYWTQAYNEAMLKSYKGLSGSLATITSEAEHDFIYNSISNLPGYLGGTRALFDNAGGANYTRADGSAFQPGYTYTLDVNTANQWYWASGCEIGQTFYASPAYDDTLGSYNASNPYYNWALSGAGHEPNNGSGGREGFLQFALNSSNKLWNDITISVTRPNYMAGYYVEYTNACGDVLAPSNMPFRAPLPVPQVQPTQQPTQQPNPDPVVGRTCQDDGYPEGYYWSDNAQACVTNGVTVAGGYKVPNTAVK